MRFVALSVIMVSVLLLVAAAWYGTVQPIEGDDDG